jgi:predicted acylesterase/phospholipase RssA
MKEFSSIVISGGAFKAISVFGVIKYLEEKCLIKNIKNLIGTSAGSIICFMIALGYTSNEMIQFIGNLPDEITQFNIDLDNILNVLDTYAIDDGNRIDLLLKKILKKKLFIDDITFLDFTKVTGKNLIVCVTNLTKAESEYWSIDTKPNFSVIQALRISSSIPLIFPPIKIDDMLYVDGGLYNNFPISYFVENEKNKIKDLLGINVTSKLNQDLNNILQYTRYIINTLLAKMNIDLENDYKNNIINLSFKADDDIKIENCKLIIPKELIDEYVLYGYNTIKHECDQMD